MSGWIALGVLALTLFGWWRLSLSLWPYAPCWWCKRRRGQNRGSNRRRWGTCRRCGGSGKRRRFGARKG